MSNPTVSFRISDYHLARGLRAIRAIEPSWQLDSPSDLIRTIFNDYIAKSEQLNNTPHDVSTDLLQEIFHSRAGISKGQSQNKQLNALPQLGQTGQSKQSEQQTQKPAWQIQRDIQEEKLLQEMKRETALKQAKQDTAMNEQINLASKASGRTIPKASEFDDPNNTESEISAVTDFSPPEDWKE